MSIMILMEKELLELRKELFKTNQKEVRIGIEKVIRRNGGKLYVK